MTSILKNHPFDPCFDLSFERTVDVPKERVWKAWTTPDYIKRWFTPAPWKTIDCEIDLRPGGLFRTTMCSPEGQQFPNLGCYLEIVPDEKLVWTNALAPGFRPTNPSFVNIPFTAIIALETLGTGTKYTAMAMHRDEEGRSKHEAMGFEQGWGKALEQLVAVAKNM